jgi:hypothetical protein
MLTDASGTITAGGTAQNALAVNSGRQYLLVHNPTTETEALLVNVTGGTAAATNAVHLAPGGTLEFDTFTPGDTVSVLAATTGHKFIIWWS